MRYSEIKAMCEAHYDAAADKADYAAHLAIEVPAGQVVAVQTFEQFLTSRDEAMDLLQWESEFSPEETK